MKFLMSAVLLSLLISNHASAQSLKTNMKSTQTLLKQIAASANDASKNAENAQNAAKMVTLFTQARTQAPDSGSFQDYQVLMDQTIVLMKELELSFKNNDNASALAVIQKLNTAKKEGHDKYK